MREWFHGEGAARTETKERETMTIRDQNGNVLTRSISPDVTRHGDAGWGVTLWFGGIYGFATNVRRVVFATRAQARQADISNYASAPGYLGHAR